LAVAACGLEKEPAPGGTSGTGGSGGSGGGSGTAGKGGSNAGNAGAGAGGAIAGSGAGTPSNSGSSGFSANGGDSGEAGEGGMGGSAGEVAGGVGGDATAGEAGEGGRSHAGAGGEGNQDNGGSGGTAGTAGSSGTGGSAGASGGMSGSGGTGGSECIEITLSDFYGDNYNWPDRAGEEAGFFNLGVITLSGSVTIEYRLAEGGGRLNGTITLGDGIQDDFVTCTHCVRATDSEGRKYIATAGTLFLDNDSDQAHGYPQGALLDVTFSEALIQSGTRETTILPNGVCLYLSSQSVDIDPVGTWTECPPEFREDQDCDCGCGELDSVCESASASQCDYCWCSGDGGDCSESLVSTTDNAICSSS
jgi:hypothetical protein